jgi:hypothetical protein
MQTTDVLLRSTTSTFDNYDRLDQVTLPNGTVRTMVYRTNYNHGLQKTTEDRTTVDGGVVDTQDLAFDHHGRVTLVEVHYTVPSGSSNGSETTQIAYEFGPFGEITKKTVSYGTGQGTSFSPRFREVEINVIDPSSGAVTSTKNYNESLVSGLNVDTNIRQQNYSFDSTLRPVRMDLLVREGKNILSTHTTNYSGDPRKTITTTLSGPTVLGQDGTRLYSSKQVFYDGCGNEVKRIDLKDENATSTSALTSTTTIAYDEGMCLPQCSTNPSGWITSYGYDFSGKKIIDDEVSQSCSPTSGGVSLSLPGNATSVHYETSYVDCYRVNGLCTGDHAGLQIAFEAVAGPGRADNTSVSSNIFLNHGATSKVISPLGTPLREMTFAGNEVSYKYLEDTSLDAMNEDRGSLGKKTTTVKPNYISEQFKTSANADLNHINKYVDPILKTYRNILITVWRKTFEESST